MFEGKKRYKGRTYAGNGWFCSCKESDAEKPHVRF